MTPRRRLLELIQASAILTDKNSEQCCGNAVALDNYWGKGFAMKKCFSGILLWLIIILMTGCTPQNSQSVTAFGEMAEIQIESMEPSPAQSPQTSHAAATEPGTTAPPQTSQSTATKSDTTTAQDTSRSTATESDTTATQDTSQSTATESDITTEQDTSQSTATESGTTVASQPSQINEIAAISANDLSFSAGGKVFKLDDSIEGVLDFFGGGFEYSESISCAHEGMDKVFMYMGIEFYTYPKANKDYLNEIIFTSSQYKTNRGVCVSDSKDKVIYEYGENYEDNDGILIYRCEAGAIWFYLNGETVESISLSRE